MTLQELINLSRAYLQDETDKDSERGWKDWEIVEYINNAVEQLCKDCHLINDDYSVNEVLATGTITLSGASGSVSNVKVNGVTITSASVPFNGTIAQTATDLANNISAYTSSPNYTATADGAIVTISAVAGTGSTPNGYVVTATTVTLTTVCTNMTGGNSVTELYLVKDQVNYGINSKILTIEIAQINNQLRPLIIKTRKEMAREFPNWKDLTSSTPLYLIPMIDQRKVVFSPPPDTNYTCTISVTRLPFTELSEPSASPGIPEEFHRNLFNFIRYRAFSKYDSETFDVTKAEYYYQKYKNEDVQGILKLGYQRVNEERVASPLSAFI